MISFGGSTILVVVVVVVGEKTGQTPVESNSLLESIISIAQIVAEQSLLVHSSK